MEIDPTTAQNLDKQVKKKPQRDELGRLLPGYTANPNGRPKGKSLKEYDREKFAGMTDEEKEEYLKKISPELRYRMAEGNPANNTDLTSKGEKLFEVTNTDGTIRIHSASRPESDSKQP